MAAVADESAMTEVKQPQQPHDDYIKKKGFRLDFQENAHMQQSPHSDSDINSFISCKLKINSKFCPSLQVE